MSSVREPSKRKRVEPEEGPPSGAYHIVNAYTGAYAALLNDDDRSEVVSIIFNLKSDINRGCVVNTRLLFEEAPCVDGR